MTDVDGGGAVVPTDSGDTGAPDEDHAATGAGTVAGESTLARTPLEVLDLSPEVWRIVAVAGVEIELPNVNPEVVLHEAQDPWRELRIPVGMAEGTAIAYAFRSIDTPRPLTHELVTEILDRHDVSVEAVRITVRRGQVFFAELDTMGPRGRRVMPCRPSDAIALALRQRLPTPILVAEWVFTGADAPPEIAGSST
ncbi:MAG TPA: bifunctional nuclease family protein [Acidimicrobiales bacterium]